MRKDDYFVENALTFKSLKCYDWPTDGNNDDVPHTLLTVCARSLCFPFIHCSDTISIQFNCLFVVVVILSFSFVAEKIYGKSERFIGFRAMGLLLFSLLFFSFSDAAITTAILFHRCHCSSRFVLCLLKICCFFIIILIKLLDTFYILFRFFSSRSVVIFVHEGEVLHLSPITFLKVQNDKQQSRE